MVDEKNDAVFRTANAADRAILKAPDGEMIATISTYLHLSADCILVHLMRTARIAWALFLAYVWRGRMNVSYRMKISSLILQIYSFTWLFLSLFLSLSHSLSLSLAFPFLFLLLVLFLVLFLCLFLEQSHAHQQHQPHPPQPPSPARPQCVVGSPHRPHRRWRTRTPLLHTHRWAMWCDRLMWWWEVRWGEWETMR